MSGAWMVGLTVLLAVGWVFHVVMKSRHPQWRVWIWRAIPGAGVVAVALALWGPRFDIPVGWSGSESESLEFIEGSSSLPYIPTEMVEDSNQSEALPIPVVTVPVDSSVDIPYYTIFWLSGMGLCLLRLVYSRSQVKRLVLNSFPAPDECIEVLHDVRKEMNIQKDVTLRFSEELTVPCLVGVRRPVIILPESMTETEFLSDLRVVLSHELAHLKGSDIAWGLVLELFFAVLWFHPLVWGTRSSYRHACEETADLAASGFAQSREVYTQILARVALKAVSRPCLSLSTTMARKKDVQNRIKRLQQCTMMPGFRFRNSAFVVLAFVLIGGISSVLRVVQADDQVVESGVAVQEIESMQKGNVNSSQLEAVTFRLFEKGQASPEDEKAYIESVQSMLETLLYADGGKTKAEMSGRKMWIDNPLELSGTKSKTLKQGEELEFCGLFVQCVQVNMHDVEDDNDDSVDLVIRSGDMMVKQSIKEFRSEFFFDKTLQVIVDDIKPSETPEKSRARITVVGHKSQTMSTVQVIVVDNAENLKKVREFFRTLEPLSKKETLLSKLNEKTFTLVQGKEIEYEGMLLRFGLIGGGRLVRFAARGADWNEEFTLEKYQSKFFREYEVILEDIDGDEEVSTVKVKIRRSYLLNKNIQDI